MTGRKLESFKILQLTEDNYPQWKFQVKLVLRTAEVWDVVDGSTKRPTGATEGAAWDKKDVEAQSLIASTLGARYISKISHCETSKAIFDTLTTILSDTSDLNRNQLWTKFYKYRMERGQNPQEVYEALEIIVGQLKNAGETVSNRAFQVRVMDCLPDEKYDGIKSAWDMLKDADMLNETLYAQLKKAALKQRLKRVDDELSDTEERDDVAYASNVKPQREKQEVTCFTCTEKGHYSRNCKSNYRSETSDSEDSERKEYRNVAYSGHTGTTSDSQWISDSGASCHITGTDKYFVEYRELKKPAKIWLADNRYIKALGKGNVEMEAFIREKWVKIQIKDVMYVPGAVSIFSENVMTEKGFKIQKDHQRTRFIHPNGKHGPEALRDGGIHIMNLRPTAEKNNRRIDLPKPVEGRSDIFPQDKLVEEGKDKRDIQQKTKRERSDDYMAMALPPDLDQVRKGLNVDRELKVERLKDKPEIYFVTVFAQQKEVQQGVKGLEKELESDVSIKDDSGHDEWKQNQEQLEQGKVSLITGLFDDQSDLWVVEAMKSRFKEYNTLYKFARTLMAVAKERKRNRPIDDQNAEIHDDDGTTLGKRRQKTQRGSGPKKRRVNNTGNLEDGLE